MKRSFTNISSRQSVGFLLPTLLFSCAALAQDSQTELNGATTLLTDSQKTSRDTNIVNNFKVDVQTDASFVKGGDVSYRNFKGNSDVQSFNFGATAEIPTSDRWFVPIAVRSANQWLETVEGVPIPNHINTLNFGVGLGYHLDEQWTVAGSVGPSIYRFSDIQSDDIGFQGVVWTTYKWRPDVTFVFGLAVQPDSEIPALPLAGVRWDIRPDLTLNLMFPRPALTYQVDSRWSVFVAGGGEFNTFRTESGFGNEIGQSRYSNALGTYRDFHLGAGAEYRLPCGPSIRIETGYSFGRQIDYTDISQTIKFENAPYVQASLKWRF